MAATSTTISTSCRTLRRASMKKTLLLCFIHGFKGGDDTFANFPSHLKAILQHALPKVNVLAVTYPKYETRGDLFECVGKFKEWLQNKVIDLEVANNAPSPTVDPSVRTILIGHSMGGIVAAETLLSIVNDQPIPSLKNAQSGSTGSVDTSTLMFPYIQGILAFDTPYLGIAPGVVAHGAEKHWNTGKSAVSAYNNLANAFGWGAKSPGGTPLPQSTKKLGAPQGTAAQAKTTTDANADAAAAPLWQRYGKVALFAGAAGAVAAGGAAAYMKRDQISQGVSFATSHLEFVGALARGEEMKRRLNSITQLSDSLHLGFANIYTTLGHAVDAENKASPSQWTGKVAGSDRVFCNLPKTEELKRFFIPSANDKALAETWAHMSMFVPVKNPGYYSMSERAKETIITWTDNEWYHGSEGPTSGVALDEEGEMIDQPDLAEEEFEDISQRDDFERGKRAASVSEEYERVKKPRDEL